MSLHCFLVDSTMCVFVVVFLLESSRQIFETCSVELLILSFGMHTMKSDRHFWRLLKLLLDKKYECGILL